MYSCRQRTPVLAGQARSPAVLASRRRCCESRSSVHRHVKLPSRVQESDCRQLLSSKRCACGGDVGSVSKRFKLRICASTFVAAQLMRMPYDEHTSSTKCRTSSRSDRCLNRLKARLMLLHVCMQWRTAQVVIRGVDKHRKSCPEQGDSSMRLQLSLPLARLHPLAIGEQTYQEPCMACCARFVQRLGSSRQARHIYNETLMRMSVRLRCLVIRHTVRAAVLRQRQA